MEQKPVVIYVRSRSPRCWRAKRLLRRRGYAFDVVEVPRSDGGFAPRLARTIGVGASRGATPQVLVDGRLVGGLGVIRALDNSGDLDRLVRGEV